LKTGRVLFKTDLLQGTFVVLIFRGIEKSKHLFCFFILQKKIRWSLLSVSSPTTKRLMEFEIYTFDSSGTLVWKLDLPEVIQDVLQVDDTLEIRDLSDQIYRFNINSGLKMMGVYS
jgi:hypothetical protein